MLRFIRTLREKLLGPQNKDITALDIIECYNIGLLLDAVYREAAGETTFGQQLVAETIIERTKDDRWPNDYASVILQPWQFSSYNADDPRIKIRWSSLHPNWHVVKQCAYAVEQAFNEPSGLRPNHFLNVKVVLRTTGKLPNWFDSSKIVAEVGNHTFLKL